MVRRVCADKQDVQRHHAMPVLQSEPAVELHLAQLLWRLLLLHQACLREHQRPRWHGCCCQLQQNPQHSGACCCCQGTPPDAILHLHHHHHLLLGLPVPVQPQQRRCSAVLLWVCLHTTQLGNGVLPSAAPASCGVRPAAGSAAATPTLPDVQHQQHWQCERPPPVAAAACLASRHSRAQGIRCARGWETQPLLMPRPVMLLAGKVERVPSLLLG